MCVHTTSRRPCGRSKQRNGGHVIRVKYSFGELTLFLCKFLLLLHYANMASGHMSEHSICLLLISVQRVKLSAKVNCTGISLLHKFAANLIKSTTNMFTHFVSVGVSSSYYGTILHCALKIKLTLKHLRVNSKHIFYN